MTNSAAGRTYPHTLTMPTNQTIRVERVFNAPRDRVWRALNDPTLIAQWWGRGNPLDIEAHDARVGGKWRYVEHSEGQSHGFGGEYLAVDAPKSATRTFEWDGMKGHVMTEAMTLESLPDGTTKLVSVSTFTTQADRDGMAGMGMEDGMAASYAALDSVLAKMQ